MMDRHWKYNLWRNAATNYVRMGVAIVSGLVTFRLLYQHFTEEQFGYWALLWSVFGMTVLLDFGLGSAAQRETAYCRAHGEWENLSRLMSTMVGTFAMLGGLILLISIVFRPYFLEMIHASPDNFASFSRAYWIFFGALAIAFPLGLFPEMLAGCQRLDLANRTMIVGQLFNLALIITGVHLGWPLENFVLVGVVTSLAPNLMAMYFVHRLVPGLKIRPKLFDFPSVKGVLSFSAVAYVITLTNIITTRLDQAVIGVCIGVASIAIYQAGYKLADVFGAATQQMQRALAPAAAHLRAKKDHDSLSRLVVSTTRLTTLIGLPAYALGVAYMEPLICLVTGLKSIEMETFLVAHFLLLATFSFLLTNSCAKQILLMSGWERPLLRLSILEAVLNLVLCVTLVFQFGVTGVAAGKLIPAICVGWFGVLPLTLKFARMGLGEWVETVFVPVLKPTGASLAILGLLHLLWPISDDPHIIRIAIRGLMVMLPVLIFAYRHRRDLF
jgi:O-antigen/teichoic acid export membrane protein